MTEAVRPIRLHAKIKRRAVSSRQISAENFEALVNALTERGIEWRDFKVSRFGHDDTLEYPVERVGQAIRDYDVSRITGHGMRTRDEVVVDLDFGPGSWEQSNADLVTVNGNRELAESVLALVRDHIDRWPRTPHHFAHHGFLFWNLLLPVTFVLLAAGASVVRGARCVDG